MKDAEERTNAKAEYDQMIADAHRRQHKENTRIKALNDDEPLTMSLSPTRIRKSMYSSLDPKLTLFRGKTLNGTPADAIRAKEIDTMV